jgi:hypothetical protein
MNVEQHRDSKPLRLSTGYKNVNIFMYKLLLLTFKITNVMMYRTVRLRYSLQTLQVCTDENCTFTTTTTITTMEFNATKHTIIRTDTEVPLHVADWLPVIEQWNYAADTGRKTWNGSLYNSAKFIFYPPTQKQVSIAWHESPGRIHQMHTCTVRHTLAV